MYIKIPHSGIEPRCGCLTLLVACQAAVAGQAAMGADAAAAFGVFFGLEVMDFDSFFVFLCLCFVLHITYTFQLFVVCVVSEAPNST